MVIPLILALASAPIEPSRQIEFTCEQVREFVAQNGKAKALAFAIKNGATLKQIREAARCLK
jgi:hypothetical protein